MAWIESHQEIAQHPKTRRLARYLGVSLPDAIGRLHLLWWWSTTYAADGDLSGFDAADLADATLWEGDPEILMDALKRSGFIDENEQIHDWHEYAGRLLDRRRQDAERKRMSRAPSIESADASRTSGGRPADVHSPSGVTVPNPTVPEDAKELEVSPAAVCAEVGADAPRPRPPLPISSLVGLSDGARDAVETWRAAHGKRSPPKLSPAAVAKLEKAVIELGEEWLRPAMTWSAERGIPEFDKAINAAYTARQRSENGAITTNGTVAKPRGSSRAKHH